MELRVLRYFLTVVREENISRAADILHVTQPTLSRQIAQLEEELGTPLFIRGKHLVLTDAGVMLRRRAEEVVQLMDKITDEFQEQEDLAGVITIGSGGQAAASILTEAMESFHQKYPRVTYNFYTNNADNIKEYLDRGLLDFGLLLEPVDIGKYDYIRLGTKERWGILMRPDHPLAQKDKIEKNDLKGIPLITTNRTALQQEIAGWFGEDFEQLDLFATYNIITNVATLVAGGAACALTIGGAVDLFDRERLTFRPLYPELSMTSVLAWKKFNPVFGAAGRFLEHFKSIHSEHTFV